MKKINRLRRAAFLAILAAGPASAGPNCAPRDQVVAALAERYGETRQVAGITGDSLMEVFASPAGTWTLVISRPDGVSCLVAAGDAIMLLIDAPPPAGDPA